jgi:hypothetical protein
LQKAIIRGLAFYIELEESYIIKEWIVFVSFIS